MATSKNTYPYMVKKLVNTFVLPALLFAGLSVRAFAAKVTDSSYRDYVITPAGDTVSGKVLSLRTASVKIGPVKGTYQVVYQFEHFSLLSPAAVTLSTGK